jgi:hypothetical protein
MKRKRPTSYLIRNIPYDQWIALKAAAERDGVSLRDLLLSWIAERVGMDGKAA